MNAVLAREVFVLFLTMATGKVDSYRAVAVCEDYERLLAWEREQRAPEPRLVAEGTRLDDFGQDHSYILAYREDSPHAWCNPPEPGEEPVGRYLMEDGYGPGAIAGVYVVR